MGGKSKEREISFKSGEAILNSLTRQGYNAFSIDAGDNLVSDLLAQKADVAIIALHGLYGEDGTVQGLLEMMKIPYSGSGVLPSALCMDKALTKQLVSAMDVPVAVSCVIQEGDAVESACAKQTIPFPLVVKPNREGSTLGISIVSEANQLTEAVRKGLIFDDTVLLESFIKGQEVTVGVLNGQALPVLEVVPESGFYDYEAKYTKGKTEYIVPARISEASTRLLQQQSERIANRLDLQGVVRVDFIVEESGRPIFLEVNTIPGMTETSLIPKAAKAMGLSFDQVVEEILTSIGLKL